MGIDDKIGNTSEEAAGKAKKDAGRATDNEQFEAEGRSDQASANVKQAGEEDQGRLQELTWLAQGAAG